MKGKVFCTERKAKSVIVIVYILCALTTASTTFEYGLTFNDECLQVCKVPEAAKPQPLIGKNASNQITYHTIQPPVGIPNLDEYLRAQLKHILANCTNHPHVIYVSLFPNNQNVTAQNFIENQLVSSSLMVEPTAGERKDANATTAEDASAGNETSSLVNTTCCVKNFTIDVELTELGKNERYRVFIYWYSALFFGIIPLALIATFNCFLVRAVYTSQKMRRVMTNSQVR